MDDTAKLARLMKDVERHARRRQRRSGVIQPSMSMDALSKLLNQANERTKLLYSELTC
ncbi:hypothetical protein Aeh1ORF257c [Aeromonas phage Aeh1]|uniref:Uncharacterized protein n=1 Tax=Aeromonas phage Aeh1 TaxID=2880362 RepID=Q76YH5_9CAUD|nr:hypothetical protein Aeh1p270 [Aeromonas phage Aeh1]AAQ17920.1 hypothetical protein Aeh1ORF257c [Aeromonas phage Aeh1]